MKKLNTVSKWLGNNKSSKYIGYSVFAMLFAVVGITLLFRSIAAPQSMYITPSELVVQSGNDITVTLRIDPGTSINAVEANIAYDQTKLQFKSIDDSNSAFPGSFFATGGGGEVNIVRGLFGTSIAADSEIAKVTFTALGNTSISTTLELSGEATNDGNDVPLSFVNATVNITVPEVVTRSASFSIEPSAAAPIVGNQFGLRVFADSNVVYEGGEVVVNLPSGLAYQGTLDTEGTAFNPATTVNGTTAQRVHIVFVTQSTTLTGKQLVATIPVIASTTGEKNITISDAQIADADGSYITPMTTEAFSININAASLPAPVISIPGQAQIGSSIDITDLRQTFTISNFDSAATYTVTLGGQNLPRTNNTFSIPPTITNGDLTLLVSSTKDGGSGNSSFTVRLRSPNVTRLTCVDLLDLLAVNKGYGSSSTNLDLNFDGTVSLIDLLTVTGSWGEACV